MSACVLVCAVHLHVCIRSQHQSSHALSRCTWRPNRFQLLLVALKTPEKLHCSHGSLETAREKDLVFALTSLWWLILGLCDLPRENLIRRLGILHCDCRQLLREGLRSLFPGELFRYLSHSEPQLRIMEGGATPWRRILHET